MAPTREMIIEAGHAVARVRLESFELTPAAVRPFEEATLTWRITKPEASAAVALRLRAGGVAMNVGMNGARTVSPPATTSYVLEASSLGVKKLLRTRTLEVDSTACLEVERSEADVHFAVSTRVNEIMNARPGLRRRRDDSVEIDWSGIRLRLRFSQVVNNWADPDVDVDAVIKLWAQEGGLRHSITSFGFDVDFPFWADAAHAAFLPAWLSLAIAEGNAKSSIRRELESGIEAILRGIESEAAANGLAVLSATTSPDAVRLTFCPRA